MSDQADVELAAIRAALPDAAGPSERARMVARDRLLTAIAEDPTASGPQRGGRRIRRMPALTLLASAAVVAAIVLLLSQVQVHGRAEQAQPTAVAVLRRAADAALTSPPVRLAPGEYWYEQNDATYLDAADTKHGALGAYVSQIERYWIGAHRWQRHEQLLGVHAVGPVTRPWQRSVLKTFGANPSLVGSGASFDVPVPYGRMLVAPRRLPALARFVLSAEAPAGFRIRGRLHTGPVFSAIHDILIEPMVPARLRADLFRLAATLPGVRALGATHDALGRPAVAIGFVDRSHGALSEFLFDPISYALLDYRETSLTRMLLDVPAGGLLEEVAFIRSALVHRAPARCRDCLTISPQR